MSSHIAGRPPGPDAGGVKKRCTMDLEAVRSSYVDLRLSIGGTARWLGCSASTVHRRLREMGIPRRPRGPVPGLLAPPASATVWSPDVAYVVGLIATDGNLSRDGRFLAFTSKEIEQIENFRRCLHLIAPARVVRTGFGSDCFRLQWSDRALHRWLREVGLMPAKSLCLGPLAIPDQYFVDFLRGCIDGDGSVITYTDRQHQWKSSAYVYQRLYVVLFSASPSFLHWIRSSAQRLLGVDGAIRTESRSSGTLKCSLRYAKGASLTLLRQIYYSPDVPCLARKRAKAEPFLSRWRPGIVAAQTPRGRGRPRLLDDVAAAGSATDVPRGRRAPS